MRFIGSTSFGFAQNMVHDFQNTVLNTRHNSADSVPTSNLVCIKEVAIGTAFCIPGIIYYTCNLDN